MLLREIRAYRLVYIYGGRILLLLAVGVVLSYWYSQHSYNYKQPYSQEADSYARQLLQINAVADTVISQSKASDFDIRLKFQQRQVDRYCQKYPNTTWTDHDELVTDQLLFNKEHKVFFCLVQKNGNTNVRLLFLIAAGLASESTSALPRDEVRNLISEYSHKTKAREIINSSTLTAKYLQLPEYFKMLMVRNPLARLVSVYRDKLQFPIEKNPLDDDRADYRRLLRYDIFKAVKPYEFEQWVKSDTLTHNLSFSEFIQFIVDKPNDKLNHHYRPVIHLCNPCSIKYDFYGSFEMYNQDVQILVDKLGAKPQHIRSTGYNDNNKTEDIVKDFYSQLPQNLKEELFRDWYSELEFYYHLYPEERNSHKALLNINEDIPIDFEQ